MNLTDAVSSGKRFARSADAATGDYLSAEEYLESGLSIDEFNATDFELEPEMVGSITVKTLATAWDAAKGSSTTMAKSDRSEFFSRMVANLKQAGVITAG